ncbi:MAG: cytochrome c oxidase assembly factor Coa1 family protein [Myxococcaceae bacterium]
MKSLIALMTVLCVSCGGTTKAKKSEVPSEVDRVTRMAAAMIRSSAQVKDAVGEKLQLFRWKHGGIGTSGSIGTAYFVLPVSGARGEAEVFVEASRENSIWTLSNMVLARADGSQVDLISGKTASAKAAAGGHKCH